ncbi:hypothetical protein IV203_033289 [Nitzschia inconspicua]|uniref:DUF6824 domain-containing protein n=1 Tax=Nitzschia inconspicua TaxID=303405 RepID=A0A9K3KL62_9STRA|nr:hypothetical protein IV203_033289 [Nitzschia inconspicua]
MLILPERVFFWNNAIASLFSGEGSAGRFQTTISRPKLERALSKMEDKKRATRRYSSSSSSSSDTDVDPDEGTGVADEVDDCNNRSGHFLQEELLQSEGRYRTIPPPANNDTEIPIRLTNVDVVCGRGFQPDSFQGNLRLHHLVDSYRAQYNKASKKEKGRLVHRVMTEIREIGGRFVQMNSSGDTAPSADSKPRSVNREKSSLFELVNDSAAYNKVSHVFRSKGRIRMSASRSITSMSSSGSGMASSKLEPGDAERDGKSAVRESIPMQTVASSEPLSQNALSHLSNSHPQHWIDQSSSLLAALIQSNPAVISHLPSAIASLIGGQNQSYPQQGSALHLHSQHLSEQQISNVGSIAGSSNVQQQNNPLPKSDQVYNPLLTAIAALVASQQQQHQQQQQQRLQFHPMSPPLTQQQILNPFFSSLLTPNVGGGGFAINPALQANLTMAVLALIQQQQQQQHLLAQSMSSLLMPHAAVSSPFPSFTSTQPQVGMTLAMNQQLFSLMETLARTSSPNIISSAIGSNDRNSRGDGDIQSKSGGNQNSSNNTRDEDGQDGC